MMSTLGWGGGIPKADESTDKCDSDKGEWSKIRKICGRHMYMPLIRLDFCPIKESMQCQHTVAVVSGMV